MFLLLLVSIVSVYMHKTKSLQSRVFWYFVETSCSHCPINLFPVHFNSNALLMSMCQWLSSHSWISIVVILQTLIKVWIPISSPKMSFVILLLHIFNSVLPRNCIYISSVLLLFFTVRTYVSSFSVRICLKHTFQMTVWHCCGICTHFVIW